MHAQHQNRRLRESGKNSSRGGNAAFALQRAIHDDHLRFKLAREVNGFTPAAGFADYLHIGLVFENAAPVGIALALGVAIDTGKVGR